MTLILDSGALIAVERGSRELLALLNQERLAGRPPLTRGDVVGQVWRGGPRQARLAALLGGTTSPRWTRSLVAGRARCSPPRGPPT